MNDLDLAKDTAVKYNEFQQNTGHKQPIDFDIKILTTSYWPTYKTFELSVPAEINTCMENFKTYYKKQPSNNHRELSWNFSMGTAIVQAKIPGQAKPYDLVVSTY